MTRHHATPAKPLPPHQVSAAESGKGSLPGGVEARRLVVAAAGVLLASAAIRWWVFLVIAYDLFLFYTIFIAGGVYDPATAFIARAERIIP